MYIIWVYLCINGAFFERVEVEFVVPIAKSRYINVVKTMETDGLVQLVWTQQLSCHTKPALRYVYMETRFWGSRFTFVVS